MQRSFVRRAGLERRKKEEAVLNPVVPQDGFGEWILPPLKRLLEKAVD